MNRHDLASTQLPEGVEILPVPRMPPAPLGIRLKTSLLVRRALPTGLVLRRAEKKAQTLWDTRPGVRRQAVATMAAIVAGTGRESELRELARRYVIEREAWDALFWQPWPKPSMDERSRERLLSVCSGRRGVVVSLCHIGPHFLTARTLYRHGVLPYIVSGEWFFEPPSHDRWGRRLARWRRGLPPVPRVRARRSYPVLASLLSQGKTTLIYFDMPGHRETRFLGKPAMLVDGTARLAVETDALVLPARPRREGRAVFLETFDAIDPRDHDGVAGLHDRLARVHEGLILECPEAMSDPAEYGWGDRATASGWSRPERDEMP